MRDARLLKHFERAFLSSKLRGDPLYVHASPSYSSTKVFKHDKPSRSAISSLVSERIGAANDNVNIQVRRFSSIHTCPKETISQVLLDAIDRCNSTPSRQQIEKRYKNLNQYQLNLLTVLIDVLNTTREHSIALRPDQLWQMHQDLVGRTVANAKFTLQSYTRQTPEQVLFERSAATFSRLLKFCYRQEDMKTLRSVSQDAIAWEHERTVTGGSQRNKVGRSPSYIRLIQLVRNLTMTSTLRSKPLHKDAGVPIPPWEESFSQNDVHDIFTVTSFLHAEASALRRMRSSHRFTNSTHSSQHIRRLKSSLDFLHVREEEKRNSLQRGESPSAEEELEAIQRLIDSKKRPNTPVWNTVGNIISVWRMTILEERQRVRIANDQIASSGLRQPLIPTWLLLMTLRTYAQAGCPSLTESLVRAYLKDIQDPNTSPTCLAEILPRNSRRVHAVSKPHQPPNSSSLLNEMLKATLSVGSKSTWERMMSLVDCWAINGKNFAQSTYSRINNSHKWDPPTLEAVSPSSCLAVNEQSINLLLASLQKRRKKHLIGLALLEEFSQRWNFANHHCSQPEHRLQISSQPFAKVLSWAITVQSRRVVRDTIALHDTIVSEQSDDPVNPGTHFMDNLVPTRRRVGRQRAQWGKMVRKAQLKDLLPE